MTQNISLTELLKSTKNKCIALAAAILIAGLFFGWLWLVGPDIKKITALAQTKKTELAKNESMRRILAIEAGIKQYGPRLSKTREVSWLIETVSRAAKDSSVTLLTITPGSTKHLKDLDKIYLNLDMECTYNALGSFVSRLESSDRFIKISSLKASKDISPLNTSADKLRVSLSVNAFCPSKDLEPLIK